MCFFNNNKILFKINMAQAYWSLLFEKEKKKKQKLVVGMRSEDQRGSWLVE